MNHINNHKRCFAATKLIDQNERSRWGLAICIAVVLFSHSGRCSAANIYLALGDSVSYGLDLSDSSTLVPSLGDQGFVRPFADYLATLHGGVRPFVKNFAIPGELSSSFYSGIAPVGWPNRAPQLNSNYGNPAEPQYQLMESLISESFNNGDSIQYVSILLGSNDLFYRVATPEFQGATAADQQLMLSQTLTEIFENYFALLANITLLLPEAEMFLPNYYNAYPEFVPEHAFYEQILAAFNPGLEQLADAYGAKYVDIYSVFDGRQLELTSIGTLGDIHPNQLGYQASAGAFIAAVPEPNLAWQTVAIVGWALGFRRGKRSAILAAI